MITPTIPIYVHEVDFRGMKTVEDRSVMMGQIRGRVKIEANLDPSSDLDSP